MTTASLGDSETLRDSYLRNVAIYEKILANDKADDGAKQPFWDVLIITASDEQQCRHYETVVRHRVESGALPRSLRTHVFADPPGAKLGSGGATLLALERLRGLYTADDLDQFRVIMVHGGGASQRLPNHSAGGKVLAPLPCQLGNGELCSMLEITLILYAEVAALVSPGSTLMTCADDLVFFATTGLDFTQPGFTAFGIRNSVAVGERHGVFVLEPSDALLMGEPNTAVAARYLEKPPRSLMLEVGAVLESDQVNGEQVFTDSDFLFDRQTALKLLSVLDQHKELVCSHEVDAYGDFLHPLGAAADGAYIDVDSPSEGLKTVRLALQAALSQVPLNVCVLTPGVFVHIGTMPEYLLHLTKGLEGLGGKRHLLNGYVGEVQQTSWPETCVLHSLMESPTLNTIGRGSVVEFCRMAADSSIGFGSIASGLRVPSGVDLPDGIFVMTTALTCAQQPAWALARPSHVLSSACAYVTPILNVSDNPKGGMDSTLLGIEMGTVLERLSLTEEEVWPNGVKKTLWTASIFPLAWSPEESLLQSLHMLDIITGKSEIGSREKLPLVSLAQLVLYKDLVYEAQRFGGLRIDIDRSPSLRPETAEWSVIAVTCGSETDERAEAYIAELQMRQNRGDIPKQTLLLAVPDPGGHSVGSGGATANAVVVVAEHISARKQSSFIDAELLNTERVLIVHLGPGSTSYNSPPFTWTGKAFANSPNPKRDSKSAKSSAFTSVDALLRQMGRLARNAPPGVWVCSTEAHILPGEGNFPEDAWHRGGITVLSVPGPVEYSTQHGAYVIGEKGQVERLMYRATEAELREAGAVSASGTVPLVCGIVFLDRLAAQALAKFHAVPGLDMCTYYGVDNGAEPLRLSLFLDIIACTAAGTTQEDFLSKEPSAARAALWKHMRDLPLHAVTATVQEGARYAYLSSAQDYISSLVGDGNGKLINTVVRDGANVQLEPHSVVEDSAICGNVQLTVGEGSLVSGMNITGDGALVIPAGWVLQQVRLAPDDQGARFALVLFPAAVPKAAESLADAGWSAWLDSLSPDVVYRSEGRSIREASLFLLVRSADANKVSVSQVSWALAAAESSPHKPTSTAWEAHERVTTADIEAAVSLSAETRWRQQVSVWCDCDAVESEIRSRSHECILDALVRCATSPFMEDALEAFDKVAMNSDVDIAGRALACIAEVLARGAQGLGGLRSGPARNPQWREALSMLEQGGRLPAAVKELSKQRSAWMGTPAGMIRSSRHYEAAFQLQISSSVSTAFKDGIGMGDNGRKPLPVGKWAVCEAPARIDLAGGWSDTPPIAYEYGGKVTNLAILIDGVRPIGSAVRIIETPMLRLRLVPRKGDPGGETVEVFKLEDMMDYNKPQGAGSLLKAALVCTGLVSVAPGAPELEVQLRSLLGGGLEIQSWSDLPQGSGMGTSSILAGAVLAALSTATGQGPQGDDELVHGVLQLEQTLTTGGGWQDQVGGLVPGAKLASSAATLPLKVAIDRIQTPVGFLEELGRHMVLVYTGRTRLAKDILQNVLRRWNARLPEAVETMDLLTENAEVCRTALCDGSVARVGACLDAYWRHKKVMAVGCEPPECKAMIQALRSQDIIHGVSLCGAGGGGFMALVTKEADAIEDVRRVFLDIPGFAKEVVTLHRVTVDPDGHVITEVTGAL